MTQKPLTHLNLTGLLLGLVVFVGCHEGRHHSPTAPPHTIVGSGRVVSESRPISGVNGLKLIGIGQVDLVQSGSEALVVEAEDNLLPFLSTEVVGGILVIAQDPTVSLQPTRRIVFHVDVQYLGRAELVGTGDITCRALSTDRLDLVAVGVGNIDFSNLSIDSLDVSMTGVGQTRLSGTTRTQHVVITGVGAYEAKQLDSASARVELVSVGSATVRVRDRLDAIVAGPGCLYYVGDPVVEASVTGPGCIKQIN